MRGAGSSVRRGSTGGVSAPPSPSGPAPEGQGGMQILAAATLADVVDVDVPVTMQHNFQQSLVLHSEHHQLMHRDRYAQRCCAEDRWDSTVTVLGPRCCARFVERQVCGIAAGAAPVVLWTLL